MANSAVLIDTQNGGMGGIGPIKVYNINLSSTNTDLTVLSATTTSDRIYVVGLALAEATAANYRFISQSGNLVGTVATTTGSKTVTGTSTLFTTFSNSTTFSSSSGFGAGGPPLEISINTVTAPLIVSATTTATSLKITTSAVSSVSAKTYKRRTTLWAPELAANQPIYDKLNNGYIMATLPGEGLILRTSAAQAVNNFMMYVIRSPRVPVFR